jgi:hypothetical protein
MWILGRMIAAQLFDSGDPPDVFTAMMAAMLNAADPGTIENIIAAAPNLKAKLPSHDPIKVASTFAALLTFPELQANCLRIEALVHLAVTLCQGRQSPSDKLIANAFTEVAKGAIGRAEDPPEDVFVGAVRTSQGNFRLLEGIWEANSFHLQRFLDTMATMPKEPQYQQFHRTVYGLLALSELLCKRAALRRHQLGDENGQERLVPRQIARLSRQRAHLRFSRKELSSLGIDIKDLSPFIFDLRSGKMLLREVFGDTRLDRQPLVCSGDDVVLLLPTAISTAIRYFIIGAMRSMEQFDTFRRMNAAIYARHFSEMPLLGGSIGASIKFIPQSFGAVAEVLTEVDLGRVLHLIFITDEMRDFGKTGLSGMNPDATAFAPVISGSAKQAYQQASANESFVDGITLVISCGVGRGTTLVLGEDAPPSWKIEFVSAYDLETLSWVRDFKPTSLWKILEAREAFAATGVKLLSMNGLLNLVAWAKSLDGHLVPHDKIPQDFIEPGITATVMVNQNSLRTLRHEVAIEHDPRVELTVNDQWLRVRHDRSSIFKDDQDAPLYASEDLNDLGKPMSVYRASRRAWWADVRYNAHMAGEQAYERWRMVAVWLSRAAPILDVLPGLPNRPILWRAVFEGGLDHFEGQTFDYAAARKFIRVEVNRDACTITTTASPQFDLALFHEENIAERALVDALVEGVEALANFPESVIQRASTLAAIMPSPQARNSHAFYTQGFRDEIRSDTRDKIVYVESEDNARLRLGMGWRVRSRSQGERVDGKHDCTTYLNALVSSLIEELQSDLQTFNRKAIIFSLLRNHEAAAKDRDNWNRTASAVLALHRDREDTLQKFADHEFKLNSVFQGSRLIIEIVNCTCPNEGGKEPGAIDLARLMAKANLLFQIGGWSDAIRWDVMVPAVTITPLGNVFVHLSFVDEIVAPHVRATSDVRVADAVKKYASHLQERIFDPSSLDRLDQTFLEAWEEQFGVSFYETRILIDFIENLGRAAGALVLEVKRSAFGSVTVGDQVLPAASTQNLLNSLSSFPTADWSTLPPGYEARDRHLWRFRRRLSVLRRPILQIDNNDDPTLIIAPGLVREAIGYQLNAFHNGEFPAEQLTPKMKTWKDTEADRRGSAFSKEVSVALNAAGWRTCSEVRVTKLLSRGFERNYGDVDVLAWQPGRILIIECKDVQFRKTYGEISEQLADFRGERRPNGRPDYLLRHLDRVGIISQYLDAVASFIEEKNISSVESHLVFKNPVPMEFALKRMSERVQVRNFDQLSTI